MVSPRKGHAVEKDNKKESDMIVRLTPTRGSGDGCINGTRERPDSSSVRAARSVRSAGPLPDLPTA